MFVQKEMQNLRKDNGITLIALIITIIILVILATISINIAYNSKIIDYTVNGTKNYLNGETKERIAFNNIEKLISGKVEEQEILEENIEFLSGNSLHSLGFKSFYTNDNMKVVEETNILGASWYSMYASRSNGFQYLMSIKKYDFSKIDKIQVGVGLGANLNSCINTFKIGLCSNDQKTVNYENDLYTSIVKTDLSHFFDDENDEIEIIEFNTNNILGNYYLKISEEHGPTPAAYTTQAKIFWIKIYYYDDYNTNEGELLDRMNSNNTDSVSIEASDNTITAYYAFDENLNTWWATEDMNYNEHWIKVEFNEPKVVNEYHYIIGKCTGEQFEFLLQSSNDGETWTNLENVTHNTNSSNEIRR